VAATTPSAAATGSTTTATGPHPGATPNTAPADSANSARQAVDAYLGALSRLDQAAVLQSAQGAAAGFADAQIAAAAVNRSAGATTTVTVSREQLSPTSVSGDGVTFGGTVQLTFTVGAASQDTISGPVRVVRGDAGWRLVSFTYDGAPLVYIPEQARQTVGNVELVVAYVLSYGALTAAKVGLAAHGGQHDLTLVDTHLRARGVATAGHGSFDKEPDPVGVIVFSRVAGVPDGLAATFRSATGPFSFDIALSGRPV
jgi:hypothetical protein